MKPEWEMYLALIGVQGLFRKRIEEVLAFYQVLYPDQLEDIFVTEYFDKDGNRQYESVWLFSSTSAMEAKQFLKEDDFDSAPLQKQIKHWELKKSDYDFHEASTKSKAVLKFSFLSGISGEMKGTRENCDHLKALMLKYIIPNLAGYPTISQTLGALDEQ